MSDGTTVAVQVVNYRTRRYLERCVETVVSDLQASGVRYEINLLDNASGEDLTDLAERYAGVRRVHRAGQPRLRRRAQPVGGPDAGAVPPGPQPGRRGDRAGAPSSGLLGLVVAGDRVTAAGPQAGRAGRARPALRSRTAARNAGRDRAERRAQLLAGDRHAPGGGVGVGGRDGDRANGVHAASEGSTSNCSCTRRTRICACGCARPAGGWSTSRRWRSSTTSRSSPIATRSWTGPRATSSPSSPLGALRAAFAAARQVASAARTSDAAPTRLRL